MTLELINVIAIAGVSVLMLICGIYRKIKVPCLLRGISIAGALTGVGLLFSDKPLVYTNDGTYYRVVCFLWVATVVYCIYKGYFNILNRGE
jgi:hypothetical protein